MVQIPPNVVTSADFLEWDRLKAELGRIKSQEAMLRRKIFGAYFEEKEGTQYAVPEGIFAQGFRLKCELDFNRTIDKAGLEASKPAFAQANINLDALLRYTPEVVMKEYRTLTAEQRQLFDQVLTIKPGMPALTIVAPKGQ